MRLHAKDIKRSLQIVSTVFVVSICVYYVILLFHLKNPIITIAERGIFHPGSITFLNAYVLFLILPIAMKGGFFLRGIHRRDKRAAWLNVCWASAAALAVQGGFIAALLVARYAKEIVSSAYYQQSRTFWLALGLGFIWWGLARKAKKYRLLEWEALKNLKAIPFVSPIFCFGVPALVNTNLAPLTIERSDKIVFSAVSLTAGIIFAVFLAFTAINDHRVANEAPAERQIIFSGINRDQATSHQEYVRRATRTGFLTFGLATYLLTLAVLDVSLAVTGSAVRE